MLISSAKRTENINLNVNYTNVKSQEESFGDKLQPGGFNTCEFTGNMSRLREMASKYPNAVVENPGTGELRPWTEKDGGRCECGEGEGSIHDNFAQFPNAVVENPGTGEVIPLGEKVLAEKLDKINNPDTPIDEAISLWKSYKKDAMAYLSMPVSFGRDFGDFSYVKTNEPNLQVAGFPKPERLRGSMVEWNNYIQEKNPDGTISLTPLQPEEGMEEGCFGQAEEGTFYLAHYKEGEVSNFVLDTPDEQTLLSLSYVAQASSSLITTGKHEFVKVGGTWLKLNDEY